MTVLRPVELNPEEAELVYQMACAVQVQGRDNLLLASDIVRKIEAAQVPAMDSLEREIARAEANL